MTTQQRYIVRAVLIGAILFTHSAGATRANESNWPGFRGPGGLGVAPDDHAYPAELDVSRNLLWKVVVPKGHSSPCIWGNKIFITARSGDSLETICTDRGSGKIMWRRSVEPEEFEKIGSFNSHATPTAVCDGKRVYVHFGSFGLLAYDLDGTELWRKPLPIPDMQYGLASSPILADNMVVLNRDPAEGAYLLALEKDTGKTVWRQERQKTKGWSTPVLWKHGGGQELVVRGGEKLISYDLKDGRTRWWLYNVPYGACLTPVYAGDTLYVAANQGMTGDPVNPIELPDFKEILDRYDSDKDGRLVEAEIPEDLALVYRYGPQNTGVREYFAEHDSDQDGALGEAEWKKAQTKSQGVEPGRMDVLIAISSGGKDDISRTHIKWTAFEGIGQVPSPLFYKGRIYLVKHGGIVTCYDAKAGDKIYSGKLGPRIYYHASPVAADGKIYFCSANGVVIVVRAEDKFEILAENKIKERIFASPAAVGGKIYLRSDKNLYAFENSGQPASVKAQAAKDPSAIVGTDRPKTLHQAATSGDIELVKSLIAGGADVNARGNWGWTPLYAAVAVGRGEIVKLLAAKGGDVDTPSEKGITPLFLAIDNGKRDIAKVLIENGADCDTTNQWGRSALVIATSRGHTDCAKLLIDSGADVKAANEGGWTILHTACGRGNKEVAEMLIDKEADIDATNDANMTPLQAAAGNGHKDVVELLLEKGADSNVRNTWGLTALGMAVVNGRRDVVEHFFSKGTDVDERGQNGETLLHTAAFHSQKEIIDLLLARGADVNAKDKMGVTPLNSATDNNDVTVVELLLESGADPNVMNKWGLTPLGNAVNKGQKDVIEYFLNNGADINKKSEGVGTLLHVAAFDGKMEMIEFLISKGADVNATNKSNDTPLKTAVARKHAEVAEMLRGHGAKEE